MSRQAGNPLNQDHDAFRVMSSRLAELQRPALAFVVSLSVSALFGASARAEASEIISADDIVAALGESIFDEPTRSLAESERPMVLLSVEFDIGRAELTADGRRQLDQVAAAMQRTEGNMDKGLFRIEGHTDSRGDDPANQLLSERRAATVVAYLVQQHGVAETRLLAEGYGESRLLVPGDGLADENRRVEIRRMGSVP